MKTRVPQVHRCHAAWPSRCWEVDQVSHRNCVITGNSSENSKRQCLRILLTLQAKFRERETTSTTGNQPQKGGKEHRFHEGAINSGIAIGAYGAVPASSASGKTAASPYAAQGPCAKDVIRPWPFTQAHCFIWPKGATIKFGEKGMAKHRGL